MSYKITTIYEKDGTVIRIGKRSDGSLNIDMIDTNADEFQDITIPPACVSDVFDYIRYNF